jgi:hypothetical protein
LASCRCRALGVNGGPIPLSASRVLIECRFITSRPRRRTTQDGLDGGRLIALPRRPTAACLVETALGLLLPTLALVLEPLTLVRVVLAFVGRQLTDVRDVIAPIGEDVTTIRSREVIGPLCSPRELARLVRYGLEWLGVRAPAAPSRLDPGPQAETIAALIDFEQLARNVDTRTLATAAGVASAYATARSAGFHSGGASPPTDDRRGIDYLATRLAVEPVQASSAISRCFPPCASGRAGTATAEGDSTPR